ncbi:hypothetical protein MRB53_037674 [Persea americana]|nr:hypothetical protein MRB53_037674 [Persea americana]
MVAGRHWQRRLTIPDRIAGKRRSARVLALPAFGVVTECDARAVIAELLETIALLYLVSAGVRYPRVVRLTPHIGLASSHCRKGQTNVSGCTLFRNVRTLTFLRRHVLVDVLVQVLACRTKQAYQHPVRDRGGSLLRVVVGAAETDEAFGSCFTTGSEAVVKLYVSDSRSLARCP